MKYLVNTLVIFSLLMISVLSNAIELSSSVDRTTIADNEILNLTVTANEITAKEIDFSDLSVQFDILTTQRHTLKRITNAQITNATEWSLVLAPKETGTLIIPSFQLEGAYSQAIPVNVEEASQSAPITEKNTSVFITASVDKNRVYVQEQVLLTLRLHYRIPLSRYDTDEIKIENTASKRIGERSFQTLVNGQDYNVLELVYALHPQSSGKLTIPVQTWRLEKPTRGFDFGRMQNPYLYVKSQPLDINVEPIPTTSTAMTWLPATGVRISSNWDSDIIQGQIGEPINYEISIIAEGLTASQIPQINLQNATGLTFFNDTPQFSDETSEKGIAGSITQKIAVIPNQAGQFIIPEISMTWWDVNSDIEKTTTLPAKELVITAALQAETDALPTTIEDDITKSSTKSISVGWKLSTAFFALLSVILGILLFTKKVTISNGRTNRTLGQTGIYTASIKNNAKGLIKEIEKSAQLNDINNVRRLVIQWAKQVLDDTSITTLEEVGNKIPSLKLVLLQLDNYLYGKKTNDSWDINQLIQLLKEFKSEAKTLSKDQSLKPLYPS